MRNLNEIELGQVSGAGCSPTPPSGCGCSPTPPSKGNHRKGNNGFGNGSDDPNLAAPGRSGGTPGDKDFSSVR